MPPDVRRLLRALFQRDGDFKHRALADFAVYSDVAVHHAGDVYRDRHSETGSLYSAYAVVVGAYERVVYLVQELLAHADSVILHCEKIAAHAVVVGVQLLHGEVYLAAVRGVFHGVAEYVHKKLPQLRLVAYHRIVYPLGDLHDEALTLLVGQRAYRARSVVDEHLQVERLAGKGSFSALYRRKVEDVVDYLQELMSGGLYFFEGSR